MIHVLLLLAIGALLVANYFAWKLGVLCGYGALRWPHDNDRFLVCVARRYLNKIRGRDGVEPIEHQP